MSLTRQQAMERVRARFGPGGAVRITQGKSKRGYKRCQIIVKDSAFYRIVGSGDTWDDALREAGA